MDSLAINKAAEKPEVKISKGGTSSGVQYSSCSFLHRLWGAVKTSKRKVDTQKLSERTDMSWATKNEIYLLGLSPETVKLLDKYCR